MAVLATYSLLQKIKKNPERIQTLYRQFKFCPESGDARFTVVSILNPAYTQFYSMDVPSGFCLLGIENIRLDDLTVITRSFHLKLVISLLFYSPFGLSSSFSSLLGMFRPCAIQHCWRHELWVHSSSLSAIEEPLTHNSLLKTWIVSQWFFNGT